MRSLTICLIVALLGAAGCKEASDASPNKGATKVKGTNAESKDTPVPKDGVKDRDSDRHAKAEAKPLLKPLEPAEVAVKGMVGTSEASFAIMADGTVRGWGRVPVPGLKAGEDKPKAQRSVATPVTIANLKNVVMIATKETSNTACAIMADGTVACWGDHVTAPREGASSFEFDARWPPKVIPELQGATDLALISGASCVLIEGSVSCWGRGSSSELANGKSGFDNKSEVLSKVAGLENVKQLANNDAMVCALQADGTVWCWGSNFGTTVPGAGREMLAPTQFKGISGASEIMLAGRTVCALDKARTLRCWGPRAKEPTEMARNVTLMVGNAGRGCYVSQGLLHCFGTRDYLGELGTGEQQGNGGFGTGGLKVDTFATVEGLKDPVAVGLGRFHTCAANAEGTWCWGSNVYANLGDGSYMDRVKPAPVKYLMRKALPEPERGYDQVPEGAPQVWPKALPEGCTSPAGIAMTSRHFKETSFELKTGYAERSSSQLEVTLLNWHGGPPNPELDVYPGHYVRGQQLRMEIELEDNGKPATKTGTYTIGADKGELKLDERVSRNSESSKKVYTTFGGVSGGVEVRSLGNDYICGHIEVAHIPSENYVSPIDIEKVSGDFIAKIIKDEK